MNPLLSAILNDDRPTVKKLLRANPTLATRLIQTPKLYTSKIFHWLYVGDTPLHLAAAGHRPEICQLLLAAGANPNASTNHRNSTPLHYAADGYITGPAFDPKRQVKTIHLLLAAGADLHAHDKNGATPLHRAVRTRCASAVECLLQSGANPASKNNPGSTPFHLAVQNTGRGGSGAPAALDAQRQIIKSFLAHGVSANFTDGQGKTVRDCARSDWVRELLDGD